jgi:hypothetical protein
LFLLIFTEEKKGKNTGSMIFKISPCGWNDCYIIAGLIQVVSGQQKEYNTKI